MKALVIGAGGVGSAIANIASRRSFISEMIIADRNLSRAEAAVTKLKDSRFSAAEVNAAELEDVRALIRKANPDIVVNAVDPRFVMPIFLACEIENVNYMDMAMSLSRPHPHYPNSETGVKLGDEQFARDWNWCERGIYAVVGMGIEPGMSDIFARYASDELFSRLDEVKKVDAKKVKFKYGLGSEFISTLKTIHMLGMDRKEQITVQGVEVSPRDILAASLPDPATLGERMRGKTCAGTLVKGLDKEGKPKAVYIYNVVDNAWSMENYGDQAVVWQTAINPVIAMELIHKGVWQPEGVNGPEWFAPKPFLELVSEYGSSWHIREEDTKGIVV